MKHEQEITTTFTEAFDSYSDDIFRYCVVQLSNREMALDITQTTFTKVWKYIKYDKKEIKNMRAFLYKVAKNLIIDSRRKTTAFSLDAILETGLEFSTDEDIEDEKNTEHSYRAAVALFDRLDEKYKDVLYMRYSEDLSVQEIASITNEKENTISVRIHRGMKQLKEILSNQTEDHES